MSVEKGVKGTVVFTAHGPTGQNGRDLLMITVVTGPNRSQIEIDLLLELLRSLQRLRSFLNTGHVLDSQ